MVAEGVTYSVRHPQGNFAVVVNHWSNGKVHPLEAYVAGVEAPRGLAAIAYWSSVVRSRVGSADSADTRLAEATLASLSAAGEPTL